MFDDSRLVALLEPPGGFTIWSYITPDRLQGVVTRSGYFGPASDRLRVGDFIFVNAQVDSALVHDLRTVTHVQPNYVETSRLS